MIMRERDLNLTYRLQSVTRTDNITLYDIFVYFL